MSTAASLCVRLRRRDTEQALHTCICPASMAATPQWCQGGSGLVLRREGSMTPQESSVQSVEFSLACLFRPHLTSVRHGAWFSFLESCFRSSADHVGMTACLPSFPRCLLPPYPQSWEESPFVVSVSLKAPRTSAASSPITSIYPLVFILPSWVAIICSQFSSLHLSLSSVCVHMYLCVCVCAHACTCLRMRTRRLGINVRIFLRHFPPPHFLWQGHSLK